MLTMATAAAAIDSRI